MVLDVAEVLAICTLVERDYHFGLAALVNSLHFHGYKGIVSVGIRGALPAWVDQGNRLSDWAFDFRGVRVEFVQVDTDWMLANYKPYFMLEVLEKHQPEATGIVYLDPDIVVERDWHDFESWVETGVAVCQDNCFPVIDAQHRLRQMWLDFLAMENRTAVDYSVCYFNSGFIGVARERIQVLRDWEYFIRASVKHGVDLRKFKQGDRWAVLQVPDQDLLNIALMLIPKEISLLGQEGMGFTPGLMAMEHAVDNPKPWRRNYVLHMLAKGQSIPVSHKRYWYYVDGTISPFSKVTLMLRRIDIATAALLSRVFGR